ncbi:MAG: phosphoglycerate kinase [Bacteroidales bacterium]|nr:phosphoglycerate kinase [Bacteroidales bacterium]
MNTINDYKFKGKKALIRVDFNVPLNDHFGITDTTRIDAALPTIRKILGDEGAVILMSHLGRPKKGPEDKFSLRHLIPYLSKELGQQVQFADDCVGDQATGKAKSLKPGEVLLLENLRFYEEETKGDEAFARKLAALGDVYVNDAFGTAHRAHASTAIIAKFFSNDKLFGYIMENELKNIDKVLHEPGKPFTAILGGAKVSGKVEIINNLLDKVDNMIIGGGMMFTFLKALGGDVGDSLVEEDLVETAMKALYKSKELGVNLYLPMDTVAADAFSNDANSKIVPSTEVPEKFMGLDIGPESIRSFEEAIRNSSAILWNGPMGVFEMSKFEAGTKAIALAVAEATQKGAFSLIGGGDSVAAINKYGLKDQVSYVSTGGGAMLEYIEGRELPGVKAIKE